VAHQTTSGVTTTTTYDVGGLEEVDAASGAVTKDYPTPAGTPAALRVGTGAVTYLATDGLGSVSAALDGSGTVTAAQLFGPYGQVRYTSGALPTTKGCTGTAAECYREQVISSLRDQAGWWHILSLGLFVVSDLLAIFFDAKGARLLNLIVDISDVLTQIPEFLAAVNSKLGGQLGSFLDQVSTYAQQLAGALSVIRGVMRLPFVGQVLQATFMGLMDVLVPGLMGPFGVALSLAEASLGGAVADLAAGGGHLAAAMEHSLDSQADQDEGLSISAFCKQDSGCPQA
jgi:hypothetical protein